jgi:hypothetical protein
MRAIARFAVVGRSTLEPPPWRGPRRASVAKKRKDDPAAKPKVQGGPGAKRHVGRVTRFDAAKGYALISSAKDVYIHYFSGVDEPAGRTL